MCSRDDRPVPLSELTVARASNDVGIDVPEHELALSHRHPLRSPQSRVRRRPHDHQ